MNKLVEGRTATIDSQDSSFIRVRRALLSVSDKTDLISFATVLSNFGVEIISTGGTAEELHKAGLKVTHVHELTGFPEMLDGRVKTLHPAIHGAVLARRDLESHLASIEKQSIEPIDLVCVNLYPFEETISSGNVTEEEAIEQIDIGGPALLRSSAKNSRFVTVVSSSDQYQHVLEDMRSHDGATTLELRQELAAAAFSRTAQYDAAISAWMERTKQVQFPAVLNRRYRRQSELRYGENPHQEAVSYSDLSSIESSVISAEQLHGKPLSYNNLLDGAAALALVQDLNEQFPDHAAAAVIKHTNPCGAAIASELTDAFDRAYAGDPLAAYGGILAVNRTIDKLTAERVCQGNKFLEVIIAPGYSDDAVSILRNRWTNVRLLQVDDLQRPQRIQIDYKSIPGGMLAQTRDSSLANTSEWKHVAGPAPNDKLFEDASVVWIAVKHLKSNAVAIGCDGQLFGAGTGQVDRVAACRLAIEKAGNRIQSCSSPPIAASEAFFPFPDGPQLLINAGIKCIVQPGGSKRDQETIDLCDKHNVTCLLTGMRHFRH